MSKDCINFNKCQIWENIACSYLSRWQHLEVVHVVWHRVPKEVPSIPNVKSSEICYNLLPLSARQHPPGSQWNLPLPSSDNSPSTSTSISHSFVPSVASFFYPLSYYSYASSLFGLFSFSSSSLQPTTLKAEAVFSLPDIHHTYETTRSDNHINTAATSISRHLQASAITFGNTNCAMDFSRNKKRSTNINSVSTDHSRHTHLEDTENEPNSEEKHDWI
jgi:hypothetical protein